MWLAKEYLRNDTFLQTQQYQLKSNFFSDEFPDHSSFSIPGHPEIGQDSGRPKGGIAMLSSKKKRVTKNRIKTDSFRIQAQVINLPCTRLLWINTYMPTDPQTIVYDNTEMFSLLEELEKIMDTADYDDVIWIGNRNWDKSRQSGFAHIMEEFISRLSLHDVWDKFPVDYTHIHTDLKSTSTLDRILVNE